MILKAVKWNKKGTAPKKITVEMSMDEAAAIAKVFGKESPKSFGEKVPQLADTGASSEVYDCLIGDLFNVHYFNGVDGYLNGAKPGEEKC